VSGVLAMLLLTSNAYWLWSAVDRGIAESYHSASAIDECEALDQALVTMARLARGQRREKVVDAATANGRWGAPYEKDGRLWIGRLGFEFEHDELVSVRRSWEPSLCDPGSTSAR